MNKNAVKRFLARRNKRLGISQGVSAIQRYQERRKARLNARFDDDDETNVGSQNVATGNTRLPYGIAKGEGIDTNGMTPKEVWEVLAGKGYVASEEYQRLKDGGDTRKHVAEKKSSRESSGTGKPKGFKKATTKLDASHMLPEMMGKAYKGTTQRYIDAINSYGGDELAVKLLSLATSKPTKPYSKFKMTRKNDGDGCALAFRGNELELVIPELPKDAPDDIKKSRVGSFVHELVHYINHSQGSHPTSWYKDPFTSSLTALHEAIEKEQNNPFSKEANDSFEAYKAEKEKLKEKYKQELSREALESYAKKKLYGEKTPSWDGKTAWEMSYEEYKDYEKFRKERDRRARDVQREWKEARRACSDVNSELQGLYDSVTRGSMWEKGYFGHSRNYFSDDQHNDANELLSQFITGLIISPEKIAIFEHDFPETSKQLRASAEELIRRLEKN